MQEEKKIIKKVKRIDRKSYSYTLTLHKKIVASTESEFEKFANNRDVFQYICDYLDLHSMMVLSNLSKTMDERTRILSLVGVLGEGDWPKFGKVKKIVELLSENHKRLNFDDKNSLNFIFNQLSSLGDLSVSKQKSSQLPNMEGSNYIVICDSKTTLYLGDFFISQLKVVQMLGYLKPNDVGHEFKLISGPCVELSYTKDGVALIWKGIKVNERGRVAAGDCAEFSFVKDGVTQIWKGIKVNGRGVPVAGDCAEHSFVKDGLTKIWKGIKVNERGVPVAGDCAEFSFVKDGVTKIWKGIKLNDLGGIAAGNCTKYLEMKDGEILLSRTNIKIKYGGLLDKGAEEEAN